MATLAPQYWSFNNFFHRPAKSNSIFKGTPWYANLPRPLPKALGLPIISKKLYCSSIEHLLLAARPSAIRRFIISVYVNPVYRHKRSWLAHIFKKFTKIKPSVANRNTSSAVMFKRRVVGIFTSLFNGKPNSMQSCLRFAVSHVSFMKIICSSARTLTMKTTARLRCARFKVVSAHKSFVSAIANALAIFPRILNIQASKALPVLYRVDFFSRHKNSSIMRFEYNTNNRRLSSGF